jgi:hypothetical protein
VSSLLNQVYHTSYFLNRPYIKLNDVSGYNFIHTTLESGGNETANYIEQPFPRGAISGGVISGELLLGGKSATFPSSSLGYGHANQPPRNNNL